jgi:hypothetical protein
MLSSMDESSMAEILLLLENKAKSKLSTEDITNRSVQGTNIGRNMGEEVGKENEKDPNVAEVVMASEVEISSLDSLKGMEGNNKMKKRRKRKKIMIGDTSLTVFINDKVIRYCKYFDEGRDSSTDNPLAIFVRENFFEKRFEDTIDFGGWWSLARLDIKVKIKTKRVNLMGNMSRAFKGMEKWARDTIELSMRY